MKFSMKGQEIGNLLIQVTA